jgi:D-galactarolactone cycloisomerase
VKITAIDSFLLSIPYRTAGKFHYIAGRPSAELAMLLVRVRTDDGLEGWGEAFGHACAASTKTALDTLAGPFFIGRDPADIGLLMQDAQRRMHIFGRSGPVTYALSGIDIALWDLAGKAAGLPLHRLLGGPARSDLPAYASLLRCSGPEAVAQSSRAALGTGVAHIKLHEIDVPSVRSARDAVGPEIGIMLDTNCPWTVPEAIEMAERLRPYRLYWLEEPVWPPEDHAGLARVRAAGAVTAAGENVASTCEFGAMLAAGAIDVAQPSVCKIGGVTEMQRIFSLAATAGVSVVPHCGYLGAGFLATLHLTATLPGEALVERLSLDLAENPFGDWATTSGGRVRVPQGPGLGCDPDMHVVERFQVSGSACR